MNSRKRALLLVRSLISVIAYQDLTTESPVLTRLGSWASVQNKFLRENNCRNLVNTRSIFSRRSVLCTKCEHAAVVRNSSRLKPELYYNSLSTHGMSHGMACHVLKSLPMYDHFKKYIGVPFYFKTSRDKLQLWTSSA